MYLDITADCQYINNPILMIKILTLELLNV